MRTDRITVRIDANESDIGIKIAAHALKRRVNAGSQAHSLLNVVRNLPARQRANHVLAGAGCGRRGKS